MTSLTRSTFVCSHAWYAFSRRAREEAEVESLRAMGLTDEMIELELAERRHREASSAQ